MPKTSRHAEDSRNEALVARRAYGWLVGSLLGALALSAGNYYFPAGVSPYSAERRADAQVRKVAERLGTSEGDGLIREWLLRTPAGVRLSTLLHQTDLVGLFVLTVERLAGQRPVQPLVSAPGGFMAAPMNEVAVIHPENADRYGPYVALLSALDAATLTSLYRRLYPLMQRAYEDLGHTGGQFHDRVLHVIDDMLAAPEPDRALEVVHGDLFYEYADADLAKRSPGQKLMLRIGLEHEIRVKRKLMEIRGLLASEPASTEEEWRRVRDSNPRYGFKPV